MDPITLQKQIRTLVEATVRHQGYDLVAVELMGGTKGQVLRLSIDRPGGISAADCAGVSSMISPVLDVSDPISGSYRLEVSSPGIDRPLQRQADFDLFAGYRAQIRLTKGHPRRKFSGRLQGTDDESVLLKGDDGAEHRLDLSVVERANLMLSLEEYQAMEEKLYADVEGGSDDQ
jgi:ribosome maturation factor RimP